jgi:hypothetical protein
MTFADLVGGEATFLDANPFVYHFKANGGDCPRDPGAGLPFHFHSR